MSIKGERNETKCDLPGTLALPANGIINRGFLIGEKVTQTGDLLDYF